MFDWRGEKVVVVERNDPDNWRIRKCTLRIHKRTGQRRIKLGKVEYDIPKEIEDNLVQLKKYKYRKLFWLERGVLVAPSQTLAEPFSHLLRPEDLRSGEERSSLSELFKPVRGKNEWLIWLIVGAVLGVAIGIMIGQNFLPHAAAAASSTGGTVVGGH